jgi:hypothetical protein
MIKKSHRLFKRILKKSILNFINILPSSIQSYIIRSSFKTKLPTGKLTQITYKLADSKEELELAFKLIQDSYRAKDISNDPAALQRVLKYNFLPTTFVFIAKYDGKVIGTISHILDSEIGLPIDEFTDIENYRDSGKRAIEISGLAICPNWRSNGEGIFLPLLLFSTKYSMLNLSFDYAFIITNLSGKLLYKNLFDFEDVKSKTNAYSLANNAEAHAQVLVTKNIVSRMKAKYGNTELTSNAYLLWESFPWKKQCSFKNIENPLIVNSEFKKEVLAFTKGHIHKYKNIFTQKESLFIDNCFHLVERNLSLFKNSREIQNIRKSPRFQVNLKIKFNFNNMLQSAKILDVSNEGFLVLFDEEAIVPDKLVANITLSDSLMVMVKADVSWINVRRAAYEITFIDKNIWFNFIDQIEEVDSLQKVA